MKPKPEKKAGVRSAKSSPNKTKTGTPAQTVDEFMRQLVHPLAAEIHSARRIILGVSPAIGEAIKWNAPSFRTTEFFATTHLRSRDRLQFIFHRGAKVRPDLKEMEISDPAGMLQWLARDRCLVTVGKLPAGKAALENIVRQWIAYV